MAVSKPVAPATDGGIWITIPEGAWGHWAEVDETGWFEAEVESGKYTVWAPNAKGDWSSDEIEVPDQQTYTKDFDR